MRAARVWLLAAALLTGACTRSVDASQTRPQSHDRGAAATSTDRPDDSIGSLDATSSPGDPIARADVPAGAAFIVRPKGEAVTLFRNQQGDVLDSRAAHDERGVATTFGVVGDADGDWIEVLVDARPNFTTAWVRAEHVELTWTTLHIVVDRDAHLLTLYDGDEVVTQGTVALGRSDTPTPTGRTFVSELLASEDPDALYGPFALGLALFSDEVTEYAGGDGQIGIHGTNQPSLLGGRVSLGCVRVHNDLIVELAGRVPLGTPVEIV